MVWLFALLIFIALAAVVAAGVLGARPSFPSRATAVVLAIVLLAIGVAFFWKHTVVALAIASVCSLAIGVMFTKVAPGKAFAGALSSFVLMFVGSWLALQIAEPLLFDRESDLARWFHESVELAVPLNDAGIQDPGFFVAIAIASLLAACFLGHRMKAVAVFIGTLLLCFFGPPLLENNGFFLTDFFYRHDPAARLVVLALIVLGFVSVFRLLANSNNKNP